MSAIHDLISQIGDRRLRERLATEWAQASQSKKFGLVFEDHLPELLPLHQAKPRKGDLVCRRQGALKEVWQVKNVKDGVITCVKPKDDTHPSEPTRSAAEPVSFAVEEMLVVREFGETRPMFPDMVIVRKHSNDFSIDILEPHDPSLADNFEKATGLARFAEKHGHLFARIQLIRKQSSPAGGEHFARLEINKAVTIRQLLLISSNPQLDDLFARLAS